jgi:cysteine-rich repeat protein
VFALSVGLVWTLAFASAGEAAVCGNNPTANPIIFGCSPLSQTCTLTSSSAPAGCELDFGSRKVVFTGTFDVDNTTLIVRAGQIEVKGALKARSDANKRGGTIRLTALDSIVVPGTMDVSGNSAGLMRLQAGGLIDLAPGGILRARGIELSSTGNSASGGAIELIAGTSVSHRGAIDLGGGVGGGGGSLTTQAGTTTIFSQPVDATGGAADGGDVDVLSGDDITIERGIDVSSNSGGGSGDVRVRAGADRVGGVKVGGSLTVTGDINANGSSDIDGGYDGGEINLAAFGPVTVSGSLRAVGANPSGGGGSVIIDSSDNVITRVTALDGDLLLSSVIDVHGPQAISNDDSGSGGDIDIFVGRDGTITGSMDLSGSDGGGTLNLFGGRTVGFDAPVNARGTATFAGGGSVTMRSGLGTLGSLSVTRTIDVTANTNGLNGDVTLAGCTLTLAPGLTIDASAASANGNPRMDLIASGTMTIGASGTYRAEPLGRIGLIHPAAVPPQIGGNVIFSPPAVHVTNNPGLFPACAVCGDGIRQIGEVCDKGAGADGGCCNADCSALTCPTPSDTPTVTPTSTAPTRTPTPTRTRTPTFTVTPTGPTGTPQPTVTPILPFTEPKPVLDCEKTLGKAASTLVLASLKTLETCALDGFKCLHTKAVGADRAMCLTATGRRCDAKLAKFGTIHAKFRHQFLDACGGDPPNVPVEIMRSPDLLGFALLQPQCFGLDLTSPDVILGCLQIITPCEAERALGVGIPRVGDLLALVTSNTGNDGACLPPPTGETDGLAGLAVASPTVRCQRTIAVSGRKLLSRQLSVARSCVDSLFKCRLSGKPREACQKIGIGCGRKLAALDDPTTGARAKMLAAIRGACGALPPDALLGATGTGFAAIDERCRALGVGTPTDASSVAACVSRAYGCAGSTIVRQTLPLVDTELARVGLSLGNDAFCALPTPTATPTPVRTATSTATATPSPTPTLSATPSPTATELVALTATPTPAETSTAGTSTPPPTETPTPGEPATPTPSPTPGCPSGIVDAGEQCDLGDDVAGDGCDPLCRFEQLVPGGGTQTTDCIAEWAVINPFNSPALGTDDLPSFKQNCVDGDPSCDADGAADDRCTFRVAICLQNADPNLPTCTAPPGTAKFVLTSPRPNSSEADDAANALALIDAFGRLSSVPASGNSSNTLLFEPPIVLTPPDNCTDTALLIVERRGLSRRSEKFRISTTSTPPVDRSSGLKDSDTLLLTCLAEPDATPTPTVTPVAAATPTPEITATPGG